jgi:1,2-diacylglycerol-3-alpha-glucose alpha-1,2-glucosyltransferase
MEFTTSGTGLLSAFHNQKQILGQLNIEHSTKWDKSCNILQINTPGLNSLRLILKAKKQKKKVIIWTHTTAEDFRNAFRFSNLLAPLLKPYLKFVYGLADILFCPSEYTKSILLKYGLDASKIIIHSNGIDTKKFTKNPQKAAKIRKEYKLTKPVIGCVGLVFPKRKGTDSFISTAKKLPNTSFIWFGKIFNNLIVKALPKKLPKNVQFPGYVPDIIAGFSAIDIFLFPSHEENQGIAILEAASMGIPIVMRDIPVYKEWFINEENCLKATTDEEFATQCKKLIEDKALYEKLSKNARLLAETQSIEAIAQKTLKIYKDLLN